MGGGAASGAAAGAMSERSAGSKDRGCLPPQGLARRLVQALCGSHNGTPSRMQPNTPPRQREGSLFSCGGTSCDSFGEQVESPGRAATALFDMLREEQHRLEALPTETQERLCGLLDRLQPADLHIGPNEAQRLHCSYAKVGYQEVYSGPELNICVFVLAAGACIPLHDHPEMHVFGRLLYGRMRVVSYDLQLAEVPLLDGYRPPRGAKWAHRRREVRLGPQPTTYSLSPEEGNIHELHALEDCAFFDVVVPPYDPAEGRNCTYYALARWPEQGEDSDAAVPAYLLVPASAGDFATESLEYLGPRFRPRGKQRGGP